MRIYQKYFVVIYSQLCQKFTNSMPAGSSSAIIGPSIKSSDTPLWWMVMDWWQLNGPSGDHVTNTLWANKWKFLYTLWAVILIVTIQSGHHFAHVTTAELSWHEKMSPVWNIIFNVRVHISGHQQQRYFTKFAWRISIFSTKKGNKGVKLIISHQCSR